MRLKMFLVASAALTPFAVSAQTVQTSQPAAPAAAPAADEQVVVVTGSRIARIAESSPVPVTVISAQTLEDRGITQVADLLETLPALSASTTGEQATGLPGRPTLNMRGMGSNRTLVLLNGKRHVAGVGGSATVDISTIPSALIERVDVLTGGASAVYGSDAVTGVVNFITKRKYEGTQFSLQTGLSGEGDAPSFFGSALWGQNFAGDKGNVTLAVQYDTREMLYYGDRDFSKDNGIAFNTANPATFFQTGDPIPAGRTPANTLGNTILVAGAPRYANTDPALIARAQAATPRAILGNRTFSISSIYGLIGLDPFGTGFADGAGALPGADLNRNGTNDCTESFPGRRFFGCWVVDPVTGAVRPFQDGLFSGSSNQIGGDGAPQYFNGTSLTPTTRSLVVNLFSDYEFSKNARLYGELKVVHSESRYFGVYKTFDDTILIRLDNPFIPTELRNYINGQIAANPALRNTYQVVLGRDNIDVVRNDVGDSNTRENQRVVAGIDGDFLNIPDWRYDFSVNYGRTENTARSWTRLDDRYFAAIDAVTDPVTGQPTCRSNLNPNALPPSPASQFPFIIVDRFTTFDPRARECRPLNLFGLNRSSREAREFVSYEQTTNTVLEQTVINLTVTGTSEPLFKLPGGPIGFATGFEWRKESSDFTPDARETLGETFDVGGTRPTRGEYDVAEAFIEVNLPILRDAPFAETLELSAAARWGDYSTIGETFAWKADLSWAPVRDIRFRGGFAVTVRAPNIGELFSPEQPVNFSPLDPCDNAQINLGPNPANRLANCRADGIPAGWVNPLTARFTGVSGGNPNLKEETAETVTAGLVLRPRFIEGLTMTVDYYKIEIEDGIAAVSGQNIVNACYDAPSLNNQFCAAIRRNRTAGSQTFLGLNFIRQGDINFASILAEGIDYELRYRLPWDRFGNFTLSLLATQNLDRTNFENPTNPNIGNNILGELDQPEWSVIPGISWNRGRFSANWTSRYIGNQTLFGVEVETVNQFTPAYTGETWVHDASIGYKISDEMRMTFGVSNLGNEKPYLRELSLPVSATGRYFFLRLSAEY